MRWISDNYKWLFDGVAGAAVIAVIGYVIHYFLGSGRHHGTAALTAQGAKVTNSPVASGSTQVVNSPTFNMSLAAPTSATPAPQEEKEQPPSVSFVQPRSILLYEDEWGVLHEAAAGFQRTHRGLIAQFKNHPSKTPGQQTPKASSVTASMVFRSPDAAEELHINHGAWLGRYEHSASFYAGDVHQLLVAVQGNPIVTLENPNSSNPRSGRWRYGRTIRHPKQVPLPGKEGEVEITLVDAWNVTVFTGLFHYRVTADEMHLKQKT